MGSGLRETDGHLDLQVFVVRMFLWIAYVVWALVVPVFSRTEGSMPVVPLVTLAGAAGLFLFRDRFSIDLLVLNSSIALVVIPALFALNVYRGIAGTFPASWEECPWYAGSATFLGFQVVAAVLAALYVRYSVRSWRKESGDGRRRLRNRFSILVVILFAVTAALWSFVMLR